MKDELGMYGDALASYQGSGELTAGDGHIYDCSFEAVQLHDSGIVVICRDVVGRGDGPVTLSLLDDFAAFSGQTDDGSALVAGGRLVQVNSSHTIGEGAGLEVTFFASTLTIQRDVRDAKVAEVRYGLTNFALDGRYVTLGSVHLKRALGVRLGCPGTAATLCAIVRADDYDRVFRRVRVRKDAARLAEAIFRYEIEATPAGADLDETVRRLVYVLSVARGTKVQWIYREHCNSAGEVVSMHHVEHVTKRFSGSLAPLPPKAGWANRAEQFVERGYAAFCERETAYALGIVIDALVDAKAEEDFIEMRGVKLAVALEILKNAFATSGGSATEFILPPEKFKAHAKVLGKEMRKLLESRGVPPDTAYEIASHGKVIGLNHPTFGDLLNGTAASVSLLLDEEELKLFVASRNALVHTGQFYCTRVAEGAKATVKPPANVVEEYRFDVYFLDRIMLALLDYEGTFVNARNPVGPSATLVLSPEPPAEPAPMAPAEAEDLPEPPPTPQ